MKRTIATLAAAASLGLAGLAAPAYCADAFPSKPLRLVIGYAAGGSADVVGRLLAKEMGVSMGQSVVVENKPGANALIANKDVERAAPDGYTLVLTSLSHVVNPILNPKTANYDPVASFSPISMVATLPLVAVTAYDSPYRSLQDLIGKAKAEPGSVTYGSAGTGGSGHLAGSMLSLAAQAPMTHIPFKGNAPALTEVMAGRVSYTFFPMVGIAELVKEKRLRVLAVATRHRMPQFPDAPTLAESGFQGFEDTAIWLGLMAPARTAPAVVNNIYEEARKALAVPAVRQRLQELGAVPEGSSPAQFTDYLKSDIQRWTHVIEESGIRVE